MVLSELRLSVRSKLDDLSYEQATVDESINWYVAKVLSAHRIRFMENTDDMFFGVGDTEADFPDDMQTLINLSVTTPSPGRRIMKNYVEYNEFVETYADFASMNPQPVVNAAWTDFGNQMRVSAPASVESTVLCEYIRRAELMVEDDDECEIPDTYKQMVVIGSLAEVMERNEDYEEAAQEREKLTGTIVNGILRPGLEDVFIKNEGRGGIKIGGTVIGTRRGRTTGYRADRDF